MEQLVARWAHNPKVAGSSPVPATQKEAFRNESLFFLLSLLSFYPPKADASSSLVPATQKAEVFASAFLMP